jgi:hypothetical protein
VGGSGRPRLPAAIHPAGISDFPAFTSQGNGLYVFSPDPAVTIYNKVLLKGQAPPATVAQIAQDGISGKYKVATYTINNDYGYSAFWGYAHQEGWAALDKPGSASGWEFPWCSAPPRATT